jgi:two-component system, NtrC family, sensor kinase
MNGSGTLTITTSPAIDLQTIRVEFTDTGDGIPEENLSKIFDPFFTTREAGKGTGLGLSTSYGIIKDHQGKISVKSKMGEGTTFEIALPVQQENQVILGIPTAKSME